MMRPTTPLQRTSKTTARNPLAVLALGTMPGRLVALASAAVFVLALSAVGWHGLMSHPEEDAGARSEAYAAMHMRSFMKWGRSCNPHCCDEVGCHPKWDGTTVANGGNTRITGRHEWIADMDPSKQPDYTDDFCGLDPERDTNTDWDGLLELPTSISELTVTMEEFKPKRMAASSITIQPPNGYETVVDGIPEVVGGARLCSMMPLPDSKFLMFEQKDCTSKDQIADGTGTGKFGTKDIAKKCSQTEMKNAKKWAPVGIAVRPCAWDATTLYKSLTFGVYLKNGIELYDSGLMKVKFHGLAYSTAGMLQNIQSLYSIDYMAHPDSYCRSDFNNHYYTEGADALQLAKDACTGTNMILEERAKEKGVDIESLYYDSWSITTDIKDLCSCITCNADHSKCGIFQGVGGKADVRSGAPSDLGVGTTGFTAYTIGDDGTAFTDMMEAFPEIHLLKGMHFWMQTSMTMPIGAKGKFGEVKVIGDIGFAVEIDGNTDLKIFLDALRDKGMDDRALRERMGNPSSINIQLQGHARMAMKLDWKAIVGTGGYKRKHENINTAAALPVLSCLLEMNYEHTMFAIAGTWTINLAEVFGGVKIIADILPAQVSASIAFMYKSMKGDDGGWEIGVDLKAGFSFACDSSARFGNLLRTIDGLCDTEREWKIHIRATKAEKLDYAETCFTFNKNGQEVTKCLSDFCENLGCLCDNCADGSKCWVPTAKMPRVQRPCSRCKSKANEMWKRAPKRDDSDGDEVSDTRPAINHMRCGIEPPPAFGSYCGTENKCAESCSAADGYERWPARTEYGRRGWRCGQMPKDLEDSRYCGATALAAKCKRCKSPAMYWMTVHPNGARCGTEPPWRDGLRCAMGTTCDKCLNPATWWQSTFFTCCGTEPCWTAGTICGPGTSCRRCCAETKGILNWRCK